MPSRLRELLGSVERYELDVPAAILVEDLRKRYRRRADLAGCMRPLVSRLPDKYREVLELTEFEGLSQVAAAERFGLATSGMKARVQRARASSSTGAAVSPATRLAASAGAATRVSRSRRSRAARRRARARRR